MLPEPAISAPGGRSPSSSWLKYLMGSAAYTLEADGFVQIVEMVEGMARKKFGANLIVVAGFSKPCTTMAGGRGSNASACCTTPHLSSPLRAGGTARLELDNEQAISTQQLM